MKHELVSMLMFAGLAYAGDTCIAPIQSIPDNSAAGVTIPIDVVAGVGEQVDSVTVGIEIVHPWVGDLVVSLRSPSGTVVSLLDRPGLPSSGFPGPFGCGGRDLDAVFDDGASLLAENICSYAGQPVIAGAVRPSGLLSDFAGEPADGMWELIVSDQSAFDAGVVVEVCLVVASSPGCAADLTGDGNLDFFDVSAFLSAYTAQDSAADFNGDGQFDFFDVSAFLNAFNAGCA